jgi:hypothetical protein
MSSKLEVDLLLPSVNFLDVFTLATKALVFTLIANLFSQLVVVTWFFFNSKSKTMWLRFLITLDYFACFLVHTLTACGVDCCKV